MKKLIRLITVILTIACTLQFGLISSFATTENDSIDESYEQINYSSSVANQPEDEATLLVSSVTKNAGQYASVQVRIENNPGVTVMNLSVDYDSSVLTLTDVEDADILGATNHSDDLTEDPYTLFWTNYNATTDFTASGVLVTLVFKIDDNAAVGEYPITLSYTPNNVLNSSLDRVTFAIVAGGVTVSDYTCGDVNSDGNVDALDCVVLARHLANWTGYTTINENAADMNNDELINSVDAMILTRHVGSWEGYSVLPCEFLTLTQTLYAGDTGHITDITGDMTVTKYKNENNLIVSVSADGTYIAKQPGTTHVTVIGTQKVCFVRLTVERTAATGITLNKEYAILSLGASEQLIATLSPENSNDTITWSSDYPNRVSVDQTGRITSIEAGAATITATTGSGKSAKCAVLSVVSGTDTDDKITHLSLNNETLNLITGEEVQLETEAYPENIVETFTWETSNANVATVSENGLVRGVSSGTAIITVTGVNSDLSETCTVVVRNQQADSIRLNATSLTLVVGTYGQLAATLTPANAKDTVSWSSNYPNIVAVDQTGRIAAVGVGIATITATTDSGKSAKCTVNSSSSSTDPGISTTRIKVGVYVNATGDLKYGTNYKASLTFSPALTTAQLATCTYVLSSENSNVVECRNTYTNDFTKNDFTLVPDQDGSSTLTGYIYSTDASLIFEYDPKLVVVNTPSPNITTPIETISLSSTSMSLYSGETASLTASVIPSVNNDKVIWYSSDEGVISVTSNGRNCTLKAIRAGTATITCKSKGNLTTNNKIATCNVTVRALGSINNNSRVITVLAGSIYVPTLADFGIYNGIFMSMTSSNVVNGISVSFGGTITIDEDTAIGTSVGVYINYLDASNQYTSLQYTIQVVGNVPNTPDGVPTYNFTIDVGNTGNLFTIYKIYGATYKTDNPNVVSVDTYSGTWLAIAPGTATVTIVKDGVDILHNVFTVDYETQKADVLINKDYELSDLADYSKTVASAVSSNVSLATVSKNGTSGVWNIRTYSSAGTATVTITFTDGMKMYLKLTIFNTDSSDVGTLTLVGSDTLRERSSITLTLQASSGTFNGPITWSITSFSGGTISFEQTTNVNNLSYATNEFSVGAITNTGNIVVTATYDGVSKTKVINIMR